MPSLTKLEISRKKRCISEGLQNTIPKAILANPDDSRFTEIYRKGFFKESDYVNQLIKTSRAADLGWIQKDVFMDAVERFKFGLNNDFALIFRTLSLEIWLRHHGY